MITLVDWHIFLCTFALFIMTIAGIQAAFLMVQDYYLRHYHKALFSFMPSVEKLEKALFRTIGLGWLVLSVIIISSVMSFTHIFGPLLREKTFLTFIAWSVFTLLLWGRGLRGWRGRTAIRWTLTGFILLLFLYCGTGFLLHASP